MAALVKGISSHPPLAHTHAQEDLSQKIAALFKVLDCDNGGTLSYEEVNEGLKKMGFKPNIAISEDEFQIMTRSVPNRDLNIIVTRVKTVGSKPVTQP